MEIFPRWEVQVPERIRKLYPGTFWRGDDKEKVVYLTFDDGPVKDVTGWVCEELKKRDIRATFFCVGENVERNQDIYRRLVQEGHKTGNHTYNHLPAWKCSGKEYFENIVKASEVIDTDIFRPPHGQLYPWQVKKLKERFRRIVMWDVLSADYDNRLSAEEVRANVMDNVRPGSVIVFHDSIKAWPRLKQALPETLDLLLKEGYRFKTL